MTRRFGPVVAIAMTLAILVSSGAHADDHAKELYRGDKLDSQASVVVWVQKAIDSEDAFKADFHAFPDSMPDKEKAEWSSRIDADLNQVRSAFPKQMAPRFLEGASLNLLDRSKVAIPVLFPLASEDTTSPSSFTLITTQPIQAYLLFTSRMNNGEEAFIHLLLCPSGTQWKAMEISLLPRTMGGLGFDNALKAARREEKAGRSLVAMALYSVAWQVAGGTRYRLSGNQHRIIPELSAMQEQHVRPGVPIATVEVSGRRFNVVEFLPVQFGSGLFLILKRMVTDFGAETEVVRENEQFAGAFLRQNPALESYFAGIGVTASSADPGDRGKTCKTIHTVAALKSKPAPATQPTP